MYRKKDKRNGRKDNPPHEDLTSRAYGSFAEVDEFVTFFIVSLPFNFDFLVKDKIL